MLELLKTLYVFQSLDLALFFFLRGRDVLVVVWPGVGDGDGIGGRRGGGESSQTLDCFCVHPSLRCPPPVCQNGLLPAKHAFTAREGLFFVDEKDTPPGLKRNPSIHKVV